MLQRLGESVNTRLSRAIPERRVILRSESGSRYFRASALMQASLMALAVGFAGWTGYASLSLSGATLRASAAADRLQESESAYETRIAALTRETVRLADTLSSAKGEAQMALSRLETEHATLTDTMSRERKIGAQLRSQRSRFVSLAEEHDSALKFCETTETRVARLETALDRKTREAASLSDMLSALNSTLGDVANARDDAAETTQTLVLKVDELSAEITERSERQSRLFAQLEDAAVLSLGSLENVFEKSGVKLKPILDAVRREHGGSGGPFIPADDLDALGQDDETAPRLAALMTDLQKINLMRIATEQLPFFRPVGSFHLNSTFGYRRDPKNGRRALHSGMDIGGDRGAAITATAPGRVGFAGWRRGYGKVIEIEHAFGYETVYAHLNRIRVKVGDMIERGDRIGDMGSTGRSTGTHLHYEVRIDGKPVNPAKYIEAARNVL